MHASDEKKTAQFQWNSVHLTIKNITVLSRLGMKVMDGREKCLLLSETLNAKTAGHIYEWNATFAYILFTPILFNIRKKITHAFDNFYVAYKCV